MSFRGHGSHSNLSRVQLAWSSSAWVTDWEDGSWQCEWEEGGIIIGKDICRAWTKQEENPAFVGSEEFKDLKGLAIAWVTYINDNVTESDRNSGGNRCSVCQDG